MPTRTQLYMKFPWTGGLNSTVDRGVINDNDLVVADNVIFKTAGQRTKRGGLDDFGSKIPAVTFRASSGTTRTLTFASDISAGAPTDDIFVVGENISVDSDETAPEVSYEVTGGPITAVTSDTISYVATGTLAEGTVAATSLVASRSSSILRLEDFWYFSNVFVKTQLLLSATSQFKLFRQDTSGNRTEIDAGASAEPTLDQRVINSLTMNNKAVFAFNEKGNLPVKFNPEDSADYELLGGSPPDFAVMTEWLGRLWTNDKSEPDRVHYSATGNIEEWNGTSDSGAIDVSLGDGDSSGITAIYAFKGILFVAKGARLLRITGDAPENFKVEPVSDGIGCEAAASVTAIDQGDVYFVSRRGFHSTQATDAFGDTDNTFLSAKIQETFNDFDKTVLDKVQGTYIPELNSAAFAISENETDNNAIYLFHTGLREWYRWPNVSCEALTTRIVNNEKLLVTGTTDGRVLQLDRTEFRDFDTVPIPFRLETGAIYPGGNPQSMKMFKRVGFLYKPIGAFEFTVQVKIDNFPTQSLTFTQPIGGDLLDVDFILNSSILGTTDVLAPFMFTIDGRGRGIKFTITQNSLDEQVEIYGFLIEFEEVGLIQEVV